VPGRIDRRALAAALNAIEGGSDSAAALVEAAWQAPRGQVIGITGPPGVGKSTLAGRLVFAWRARGLTVGALCIDPSSRRTGGALLGDRLRMRLSGDDPDVFVRSLAARGHLGGLAPRAFEAVTVLRAHVDRVLVETVGVGQSEVEISRLADLTAVVIQPGSGDALQFLKAGLMEVFDLLVVNKADLGVLAENAARELRSALRVQGRRDVPVVMLSAEQNTGVEALVRVLEQLGGTGVGKRETALRETVRERFTVWHGERVVTALGGHAVLTAALDAVSDPSPARLAALLEGMAAPTPTPWLPEVEVDAALARTLVAGVAPGLLDIVPEPLGSGWDNTAWLFREPAVSSSVAVAGEPIAGDAWVFRFPRRTIAAPLLARELEVMATLAPHLPLPVTAARWRGVMPNGWQFGGYRFLPGDIAAIVDLDDATKLALAPVWGGFVRALHALDLSALGVSLPNDSLGKVDVTRRWDVTRSTLASTNAATADTARVLERAREVWTSHHQRPQVTCHGDLDARHLLVDRSASPTTATGVIDWGDLLVGDPAIDLGMAFSFLEGPARNAFFDVYGDIDPVTEGLARFRALSSQAWILSWANDIGHHEHASEARRGLVRATR